MVGIYDAKPSTAWCDQDAVGMRYHLSEIKSVTRQEYADDKGIWHFDAVLVLEPDNPYSISGHAVSVRYDDQVIGYLPEIDAVHYFPEMARLAASGFDAGVNAKLWANTEKDTPYFSLKVGVLRPGTIVPSNDPPDTDWALIPPGRSIKVTKTQDYYEANKNTLPISNWGTCYLVTLHKITRGTKSPVVEVRIDGQHVGELTELSSAKLMPYIDRFTDKGLSTVCRAQMQVLATNIKITLNALPAEEAKHPQLNNPVVNPLPVLVKKEQNPQLYQPPGRFKRTGSTSDAAYPQGALSDKDAGCAIIVFGTIIILTLWWLASCMNDAFSGTSSYTPSSSTSVSSLYGELENAYRHAT